MVPASQFFIEWMTSVALQTLNPHLIVFIKSETEFSLSYFEHFRLLIRWTSYRYEDAVMSGESEKQRHSVRRKISIENRNCPARNLFDRQFLVPKKKTVQQPTIRIRFVVPDDRVIIFMSAPRFEQEVY